MIDAKGYEPFWENWYIAGELGEGGFGRVYKIKREEFGDIYYAAMKHIRVPQSPSEIELIRDDGIDDNSIAIYFEDAVADIVNEFKLMFKLKGNSNIVSYEDHQVKRNNDGISWDIFIKMELLTNLSAYIRNNDLTYRDVIRLGIDMCRALEICQKHNIIHRDIKPENIFVSENGDFKLGDFGIARQVEKTMSGLSQKGTFAYIAPEVYKGEAYGSLVDIYSLGLVMYRLLNNNRMPFMPPYPQQIKYTDRENALLKRVTGEQIPPPAHADDRLAGIVLKACAYEPAQRFSSPAEMRASLEAILHGEREHSDAYFQENRADPAGANKEAAAGNMSMRQETEETLTVQMVPERQETEETLTMQMVPEQQETEETLTMQMVPERQETEETLTVQMVPERQETEETLTVQMVPERQETEETLTVGVEYGRAEEPASKKNTVSTEAHGSEKEENNTENSKKAESKDSPFVYKNESGYFVPKQKKKLISLIDTPQKLSAEEEYEKLLSDMSMPERKQTQTSGTVFSADTGNDREKAANSVKTATGSPGVASYGEIKNTNSYDWEKHFKTDAEPRADDGQDYKESFGIFIGSVVLALCVFLPAMYQAGVISLISVLFAVVGAAVIGFIVITIKNNIQH